MSTSPCELCLCPPKSIHGFQEGWSMTRVHDCSVGLRTRREGEGGGGSTVGGLDRRQCQDAVIVGEEGLCVAPGPENRQQ